MTTAGRRAWFCTTPRCQWQDLAVYAVYIGKTDTLENFRTHLWDLRMAESRDAYWPVRRKESNP